MESSIPLSEYASKLEEHVKQRYLQKISSIGVDPALIEGKLTLRTRQPDCLPPVESIDLLFYLVLETSFYALPSAAYKPIIKWFQGLLRVYRAGLRLWVARGHIFVGGPGPHFSGALFQFQSVLQITI